MSCEVEGADREGGATSCASHGVELKVTSKSLRMANFLGEVRREKNGAVADFMRFYGKRYGLNYGVSLSTVRSLARQEADLDDSLKSHKFAKLLYQQEVRELRLAALWLADIEQVESNQELDFWACGIINSEVAEEAAFALFYRSSLVDSWLDGGSILLQYCAIMAMAKRCEGSVDMMNFALDKYSNTLAQLIEHEPHIIPKAVVALFDSAIKSGVDRERIISFMSSLPSDCGAANYLREEIAWRLEFC